MMCLDVSENMSHNKHHKKTLKNNFQLHGLHLIHRDFLLAAEVSDTPCRNRRFACRSLPGNGNTVLCCRVVLNIVWCVVHCNAFTSPRNSGFDSSQKPHAMPYALSVHTPMAWPGHIIASCQVMCGVEEIEWRCKKTAFQLDIIVFIRGTTLNLNCSDDTTEVTFEQPSLA